VTAGGARIGSSASAASSPPAAAIAAAVRATFAGWDFLEVETPALQVSPGLEPHLMAFATDLDEPGEGKRTRYLRTSPEFTLKKLLAAGVPAPLTSFARVFRNGERSATHHPEFTMLEWYRARASYRDLWWIARRCCARHSPPRAARSSAGRAAPRIRRGRGSASASPRRSSAGAASTCWRRRLILRLPIWSVSPPRRAAGHRAPSRRRLGGSVLPDLPRPHRARAWRGIAHHSL